MPKTPPTLAASKALRAGSLAAAGVLFGELAYAVLRPAPPTEEFDPSGRFGNPRSPQVHIGVMGDSSCTGPGLSSVDETWVRQAARDIAQLGFHVKVSSVAVGGARVPHLLAEQLQPMLELDPDVVLVSVGGNDALRGIRPSTFERDLTTLTETLVATGALVILSGVGDLGTIPRLLPPWSGLMRRRSIRFDEIHATVAERHGAVKADQWAVVPSVFSDPGIFTADLFHPGPAGHRQWADVAVAAISPHLKRFESG